MITKSALRPERLGRIVLSVLIAWCLCAICGADAATAYADSPQSAPDDSRSTVVEDTAGTAFSSDSQLLDVVVSGDLFWGNSQLMAQNLQVGKDLVGAAGSLQVQSAFLGGDLRFVGQSLQIDRLNGKGNATLLGQDIDISQHTTVRGLYVGAGEFNYQGTARYAAVYANKIYFDGTVNGDVTLSAQDIVIGPHAKVTGTLNIRSGQAVQVPDTARIASVDTSLDNPNAIDQVSELRAKIAPYFQLGSILFIVVASILVALLLLWVGERQLREAHRALRRRPFGQIVLGLLTVIVLVVATIVCLALVLTIPAGLALLFLLLAAALVCVPFAGASLGLAMGKFPRAVRVVVGAGIAGALLLVPYVQWAVLAFSLIYLLGYLSRSLFVGHDDEYLRSFAEHRRAADSRRKEVSEHQRPEERESDVEDLKGRTAQISDDSSAASTEKKKEEPPRHP